MILKAKKLFKSFKGKPPIEILKGISFQIEAGETVAIMGKSGEGKSTLLHIFGTLEAPTEGSLLICGKEPQKSTVATLRNEHIGFVFQAYHLLEDFSTLDNVLMPLKIGRSSSEEGKKKALDLLKEVGLYGKEKTLVKYLSGGEKQRVAIARSLMNEPDLILADEPTGNLDQSHSQEIQDLLLGKAKQLQKALIVVTHDEDFASKCDRLLFLKEGQLYNPSA